VERVDGKAAGDHGFITCQRIGLADRARADAIPNAAGGEGGHEAAKPNGVIHRYLFNRNLRFPGDLTSASSWRNEKPRLRSWKLEPNPTAIREGPTERKTAHETTGSTIRRLRGVKVRCWTATCCKGLSARANSGVEDRRECR
jgi:hypothetical protein